MWMFIIPVIQFYRSPTKKKVEQLLSDSWFDLDVDNIEGETGSQDEDDLLREIDELLA